LRQTIVDHVNELRSTLVEETAFFSWHLIGLPRC
jgi:hypothetical protein